jgi:hypothetical protein
LILNAQRVGWQRIIITSDIAFGNDQDGPQYTFGNS